MSARGNGDPGALPLEIDKKRAAGERVKKKGTGAQACGTGELNNGSGLCGGEQEKINSGTGAPGVSQSRRKTSDEKNQAGVLARADKELDGKIGSPETPRHVLRWTC
jgi:hypothetical protein